MPGSPLCATTSRVDERVTRADDLEEWGPTMTGGTVVVTVTIEAGEPFAGTLRVEPDEPGLVFSGWLGFMEAIEVLKRRELGRNMGNLPDDSEGVTS